MKMEFYIADYIFYHSLFSALSGTKHQVVRMTSPMLFMEINDKRQSFPIAKQYINNQFLLQTFYKYYLDGNARFLDCLQVATKDDLQQITKEF